MRYLLALALLAFTGCAEEGYVRTPYMGPPLVLEMPYLPTTPVLPRQPITCTTYSNPYGGTTYCN